MSIYVIGDLHLSLSQPKAMDIFPGWQNYMARIEDGWRSLISENDTVVIAGDISWAMKLHDALDDLRFIEALPGKKLIMKGNHDYWWSTKRAMEAFLSENGLNSISILHNNSVVVEGLALCGSRGWIFENSPTNGSVILREAGRIRRSLEAAEAISPDAEKVLFLHYPPIYGEQIITDFFDIMQSFGVRRCFYGHLHGPGIAGAFNGSIFGVQLKLISADNLKFLPLKIN